MKILLWIGIIVAAFIGLLVVGFVLLTVRAMRVTVKRDRMLDQKISPVMASIKVGNLPDQSLITKLAEDPLTRNHLLAALSEIGRPELFPEEFRTSLMIAESDLVRWLAHGNELGSAPDEIEFVFEQRIESEGRSGTVYLFRFRVDPPHWASEKGWIAGVSGPFWSDEPDANSGQSTFSELESYSGRSDSEHIEFLSRAATSYGWVMPTPTKN